MTQPRRGVLAAILLALLPLVALGPAGPADASASHGRVVITTVPALAGVRVAVGATQVTTGADGTVTLDVADLNGVASRVSLVSTAWGARSTLTQAFVKPQRDDRPRESHVVIGIDITSHVRLALDPGTTGVASSAVTRVRLHSVTGEVVVVDPRRTRSVALLSRKARLVRGVATSQVVTWNVDSARAGPGVSLAAARTSFDPFAHATFPLVLHTVRGTLVVDTVPATAGVSFLIDGATMTTDQHGRAVGPVADLNAVGGRLTVSDSGQSGSTVALVGVARIRSTTPLQRHVVVGLEVTSPVTLAFTDPAGAQIPVSRIASVQLAGGGNTVSVTGEGLTSPVALLAQRARLIKDAWTAVPVNYSITRVTVDGADAVFAGQQRFTAASTGTWPIALSMFDLRVTYRDVLFGNPVASDAVVTRPDGVQVPAAVSPDGVSDLKALVRGEYVLANKAAIVGGKATVLVSKDSAVELKVITLADVLVVGLLMLGLCVSLVWLGLAWSRHSAAKQLGRLP